jgi:endoplasmic reticulum protein 29
MPDLLVAEVGIKDYGDYENAELAKRFNVKKEDFPVLKLFLQNSDEPIDYVSKDFKADAIKKFIRSKSGVYIGLPGCLESFDGIAIKV